MQLHVQAIQQRLVQSVGFTLHSRHNGHFRDSLQAINCTDTDNRKQRKKITRAPKTQKTKHREHSIATTNIKLQNPRSVIFYDIW